MNWIVVIFLSCSHYIFGDNHIYLTRRNREREEDRRRQMALEIIFGGHPLSVSMQKTVHYLRHPSLDWEEEDTSVDILPWWQEKERDHHAGPEESVRSNHPR